MAYDNIKLDYGKEHIYIVDITLPRCIETSGVAPCLATETGDDRCFNTLETCNFLGAYNPVSSIGVLRFYQDRTPAPIGFVNSLLSDFDPIPSLVSVNTSPAKIDLSGGLGVRASVTCTFKDHPHSDISLDKYIDDRTYIASDRGSFWTKLRARNPDYENKQLRVLSGFLVDGVFRIENFTTRYYIIDKMTVTNGMCTITAKDPLKLASNKKPQAPAVSTGQLSANITAVAATANLVPVGVGNLEYPVSGKILINSEVISFTRINDALTLTTRAQNNTVGAAHNANDTVQVCLEYLGKQVDFIVDDLLTNYANIAAAFIPNDAWASEVGAWLNGGLSGIIVKPFDVFKLLKELSESMPHYLWWDERAQVIQLTALKGPNSSGNVIDMDSGIVKGSFRTMDRTELRKSSIFINFGQFDPTKKLDDFSNYQQTYVRADVSSISKYGSNEIMTINSRWISNSNKGAALQLAALIGRRFSDVPREIKFSLEAKDSNFWAGQTAVVNHRDMVDFTGLPVDIVFQLLSSKEGKNFDYKALEFAYGEELNQDEGAGGGVPGVINMYIPTSNFGDMSIYNMRTEYNLINPVPDGSTHVVFFVENGVRVSTESTSTYTIDTGSWPELGGTGSITLQTNIGSFVVGKGGDAGGSTGGFDGHDGGPTILMNSDLTLINNGIIGSGGGGGAAFFNGFNLVHGGGGGAGDDVGFGGVGTGTGGMTGSDGTLELGGERGHSSSGNGGDLGEDGDVSDAGYTGGLAGVAINKNGYTLTETVTGDIRGNIVA